MSAGRPNILIFMSDQQCAHTVDPACPCPTPNADRLAGRGVRFTHGFTPSPVCTPARASLLTGLEVHKHRLTHVNHANYHVVDDLDDGITTFAQILSGAGYRCGYAGKWHVCRNKGPTDRGFGEFDDGWDARTAAWPELSDRIEPPVALTQGPGISTPEGKKPEMEIAAVSSLPKEESEPFKRALAARDMLRRYAEAGGPFCIWANVAAPHVPWLVPRELAGSVDPESVRLPESFGDDLSGKPDPFRTHYNTFNFCPIDEEAAARRALARYYEFTSLADAAFGLVLDEVDRLGLAGDTVVIYASDHGEMAGAHGLFGKDDMVCDPVIRIPFIVSWPGRFEPGVRSEFVSLIDGFATIVELAGAEADDPPPTSRSLVPLLEGQADPERFPPEVFCQHFGNLDFNTVRCIRTDRWKYVWWCSSTDELYDLAADPFERRNLAGDPAHRQVLRELRGRLAGRMAATGDNATKSLLMAGALDDYRQGRGRGVG